MARKKRGRGLVGMWGWVAAVSAGVLLGVAQVALLRKMVRLKEKKVAGVCLAAKMLLWVAAILGAVLINEMAVLGVLAGAAPVYSAQMVILCMHKGE